MWIKEKWMTVVWPEWVTAEIICQMQSPGGNETLQAWLMANWKLRTARNAYIKHNPI